MAQAVLRHTRTRFDINIDLASPAVKGLRTLAMLLLSRSPPSLVPGLQVSAARSIWSPTIPRPSFIDSIRLASSRTRTSVPIWAPRIYTLQDLVQKRPYKLPEADKFQSYTQEDIDTWLSRTKGRRQLDENYQEVSCLPRLAPLHPIHLESCVNIYSLQSAWRPSSGTTMSDVGQRGLGPNEELVEIKLIGSRREHNLSSEEIRSRAIGNFVRGYVNNLFDSIWLPGHMTLVYFVKEYDPGYFISRQNLNNLKKRPMRFRYLPVTKTSLDFISFINGYFPDFNGAELFALSGTHVSYGKILLVRRTRYEEDVNSYPRLGQTPE